MRALNPEEPATARIRELCPADADTILCQADIAAENSAIALFRASGSMPAPEAQAFARAMLLGALLAGMWFMGVPEEAREIVCRRAVESFERSLATLSGEATSEVLN